MKKALMIVLFVFLVAAAACVYGIYSCEYEFFPYRLLMGEDEVPIPPKSELRKIYKAMVEKKKPWCIGIYSGDSPLAFSEDPKFNRPVLDPRNLEGVEADFIADPFLFRRGNRFFLFFELMNRQTGQGDIAYAESTDGFRWEYKGIVLDEPFHLSYPYVFRWNNDVYMIPESGEDLSVRLYKAVEFPAKWKFEKILIRGYHFADPSIVHYKGTWWLFVSARENDVLNLYYSDTPYGPWTMHPASPVVKGNKKTARPGGKIFLYRGKLYRFAQDCSKGYGMRVYAIEITKITRTEYKERPAGTGPAARPGTFGWNSTCVHTVQPFYVDKRKKWFAVIDAY